MRAGIGGIHLFLGILSIAAAAGVPVAIALGAPSWVAAILGAVAAVAQGVLQLTHVDLLAFELHSMLVRLSSRRDQLKAELRRSETSEERTAAVDTYERDVIALLASYNDRLAGVDRQGSQTKELRK